MHLETLLRPADSVGARPLSGLLAGANVLTLDGELPVETLAAGDRIITRDRGMAVLKQVNAYSVKTAALRIAAGTLGTTRPDRDAIVAKDAKIHIRDWRAKALYGEESAFIPAHRLLDGQYVTQDATTEQLMFELVFDDQHILYVDGLEIASAAV